MTKKIEIEPVELCKDYEDEKSPCYICFVKGVCTTVCQGLWDYNKELTEIGIRLGKKWIPGTLKRGRIFSFRDILEYFKSITNQDLIFQMLNNDETLFFIKDSQYYLNRQSFILKNYMNKNKGASFGFSSTSSSSISSSQVSTTSLFPPIHRNQYSHPSIPPPKNHLKNMIFRFLKPSKKFNQNTSRGSI